MNRGNKPWQPVTPAALQWEQDGAPRSTSFGDIYYSSEDGLAESRYVFLEGNGLPTRWQAWPGGHFCIAETGFGTGLNFLLTWQAWLDTPRPRPRLHYLSFEQFPLAPRDLQRALSQWPQLAPLAAQLVQHYPGLVPGQHRLLLEAGQLTLDLWWEDVNDALPDLAGRGLPLVDAWYLDGFAPASNEAMWRQQVLDAVARLSRPGATFSTFTAAGQVRRQLAAAGFEVVKAPGFGRKRECLRGRLEPAAATTRAVTEPAWDRSAGGPTAPPSRAIVLGAGLAGCTAAAALARRGVQVTLLERQTLAGGGSGNEQGILYTRLSPRHSPLVDFALQSFCFSSAFYRQLFASGALVAGRDGELCGSFHQHQRSDELAILADRLGAVPDLASVLEPDAASELLGVAQDSAGYWFPRSGWLHPAAVCRALSRHPGIELLEHRGAITLSHGGQGWRAQDAHGNCWEAPCVVIATGTASVALAGPARPGQERPGLTWLPLQSIRGQTTRLPAHPTLDTLRSALCHQGYIAPAANGNHCIGATFNLRDEDPELREADHRDNLSQLARAVPAWAGLLAQLDPASLEGRVGFRCASPDYLPLAGPVPDHGAFLRDYAALRNNARSPVSTCGQYLPGLYLSSAHGSRGLSSTPLVAELIASEICGEPPPLSRELARALAPGRFIIRDLSRNRI
ncbi:MAG: bifunctional tRNA (5-methylaminomethyl-2-thiouridine)(34)-methyltransferase MnmD/FAD-dependent 5-carboxymethylaminomethyl-2-thiouridine(34) oxidoreductase MnmC [Halieaceae bacterium]|nr:bifunctional tRNA (5-methylaminomethyl-2-thiouridine)(34)-methyltransferase MnmD/FAD-dependent 5-carboxymethylaminomethyl-2-thiouridine(34) oxidoreductase MnmC [Halieaceae bacterium]